MLSPKDILRSGVSLVKPIWTDSNELALGIHTEPVRQQGVVSRSSQRPWWRGEPSQHARHDDNHHYATIDYWNVRRIVRALKAGPDDVFYDIGSGMGRILCVMARQRLRKCIGIELFEPLCEIARRNAANLRGRKTPIEVVCGDATNTDLGDGTIYFMFNPFGAETMRDTLDNLRNSLLGKPRSITVVYYNAQCESVFEAAGWLEKIRQFDSFNGQHISFWRNKFNEDRVASKPAAWLENNRDECARLSPEANHQVVR